MTRSGHRASGQQSWASKSGKAHGPATKAPLREARGLSRRVRSRRLLEATLLEVSPCHIVAVLSLVLSFCHCLPSPGTPSTPLRWNPMPCVVCCRWPSVRSPAQGTGAMPCTRCQDGLLPCF